VFHVDGAGVGGLQQLLALWLQQLLALWLLLLLQLLLLLLEPLLLWYFFGNIF
jgi:hypothetical protein